MKPYYQDEWVTIYHGDCREMPKYDAVLLTDPPYGVSLDLTWLSELHLAHSKPANKLDKAIIGDDKSINLRFLFDYERRLIFGFPYIYDPLATGWLVWDKQPGIDADRTLTSPVEMSSTTLWKGFRLVRCMWAGYMRDGGEYRYEHPTQKPQKIIISSMSQDEAKVFIGFLESEMWRHQEDIQDAQVLIETVKHWYEIKEE